MIPVPHSVMNDYIAILRSREIPLAHFEHYKKWLRYFYDFYSKYLDTNDKPEKVRLFLEKLRSKKQTPAQCQQAAHAISLYFEMQGQARSEISPNVPSPGGGGIGLGKESAENSLSQEVTPLLASPRLGEEFIREPIAQWQSQENSTPAPAPNTPLPPFKQRQSQYSEAGHQEKSDSPEWDTVLEAMATEIKVRHYSRKTLQTYANWSQ